MPGISVLPESKAGAASYDHAESFSAPAAPARSRSWSGRHGRQLDREDRDRNARHRHGIPAAARRQGASLIQAIATTDPSSKEFDLLIGTLRDLCLQRALSGDRAENHDSTRPAGEGPLVIGAVLLLGFLAPPVALQAVFIAVAGVIFNLLSVGAAFGVGAHCSSTAGWPGR
jgi:hypothetical protein